MYKIAIIGGRDSVMGYMALGFSVHEASDVIEAGRILSTLADQPEYAVIFITEDYARALEDEILKYRSRPLPAITPIPGQGGSTGYGTAIIKNAVERAVGSDIVFNS